MLYQSCLKMLKDKYNLNEFSKDIFMNTYTNIYEKAGIVTPNNELNKTVLISIKNMIESKQEINNENKNEDLELKIREAEALRASISKININDKSQLSFMAPPIDNTEIELASVKMPVFQPSIIKTNQVTQCKTFIINTTKNNFRVSPSIDIKFHSIYPVSICVPSDIKYKTPYLILVINDGIKQVNYTYIPSDIYNSSWDTWKPIINDYIDITLGNNNWNITLIDYLNNQIDMNEYIAIVNDVLMVNNNYTLNVNKPHYFSINDKIKIIKNNGYISDNIINNINGNIITINKNNLEMNDFINSKIINYKHNISIIFKYHLKQQEQI